MKTKQNKKLFKSTLFALIFLLLASLLSACDSATSTEATSSELVSTELVSTESTSTELVTEQATQLEPSTEQNQQATETTEIELSTPKNTPEQTAETSVIVDLTTIPEYSGAWYVPINNNVPFFAEADLVTESYEYYAPLDESGRCGVTVACIGQDLMPTDERGAIGDVRPSGWHTIKYDFIDGKYLYNRCHLIGWQLAGENANTSNLITGTRQLNVGGMLLFENLVADYIKETGNHVMYRVIPIFDGTNLVANGVQMEAYSVEDDGFGICYNVFVYNAQDGVTIDYATGDSASELAEEPSETETESEEIETHKGHYAVNERNGKIHMVGECPATGNGANAMKNAKYFDTYEEAEAYSKKIAPGLKKRQCGNCWR